MAREVELAENFINDFAEELIHVRSHVIHNAAKSLTQKKLRGRLCF
jgi:hypothetical protein